MKTKKTIYSFCLLLVMHSCFSTLNITAFGASLPSVTTNYQIMTGRATSARISVENNDTKNHRFTLKANQLPKDFNGYFTLDGKVVNSINISATQKSVIQFCVDTPINPSTREINVPLQILRDDGVEESIYLSYTLNQDYSLEITNNVKSVKAVNGNSIRLEIGVTDTGNKELKGINLQADLPYKWLLEKVEPNSLNLKPNESGIYVLNITIPSSQPAGEFPIKITGLNTDTKSNEVLVPVVVSTSVNYLWWVVGGIVILLVFTIVFFKKHGRR